MLRPPSYYMSTNDDSDKIPLQHSEKAASKPDTIALSSVYDKTSELQGQIEFLTIELNRTELSYSSQIRELNEHITRNLREIQILKQTQGQTETHFLNEKVQLENKFSSEIQIIQNENQTALEKISELEILLTQLENEKHDMEQQIFLEKEENNRLKMSLDSIVTYPDREESYKGKIDELTTQLEHETKKIQLLNLRLEALQDILSLQEKNMTQNSNESFENVLTTWRGKVFELLMREKIIKHDVNRSEILINNELKEFTDKIVQLENESKLLKLCINEKSAQVESLNEEIRLANCKNGKLLSCITTHQQRETRSKHKSIDILTQIRGFSTIIDVSFVKKLTMLSTLQHRILFLTERVGFLVGYLTDNQSRLKPQKEISVQTSFPDSCLGNSDRVSSERIISLSHGTLVNEVQLLVRERSILQNKLKDNSDKAMRKMQSMCKDTNSEKERLLSEINELNFDKNNLFEEKENFREDLEKFKLADEKKSKLIDDLEQEIAENKRRYEQQRRQMLEDIQTRHTESLNDLDNRLREMCDNYAEVQDRARNAENNTEREVEHAIGSLKIENQDLQRKLEEMRIHLKAVESEKNMLSRSLQTMTASSLSNVPPMLICPQTTLVNEISMQTEPTLSSEIGESETCVESKDTALNNASNMCEENLSEPVNHVVTASEFYSMVQDIAELSSHVFSM